MCWVSGETQKCLDHQKLIPEVVSVYLFDPSLKTKIVRSLETELDAHLSLDSIIDLYW